MANEQNAGNKNDVVMVGCKLPNGYIMELIPKHDGWNPPPTGPRVTLNGANTLPSDNGLIKVNPRVLGYGRTMVNRSFWDQWLAANKDREVVVKGFIFAETKADDFRAHAKEKLPEKTGLEGLSPDGTDERIRKVQIPGHAETKVETDAEHLQKLQRALEAA